MRIHKPQIEFSDEERAFRIANDIPDFLPSIFPSKSSKKDKPLPPIVEEEPSSYIPDYAIK